MVPHRPMIENVFSMLYLSGQGTLTQAVLVFWSPLCLQLTCSHEQWFSRCSGRLQISPIHISSTLRPPSYRLCSVLYSLTGVWSCFLCSWTEKQCCICAAHNFITWMCKLDALFSASQGCYCHCWCEVLTYSVIHLSLVQSNTTNKWALSLLSPLIKMPSCFVEQKIWIDPLSSYFTVVIQI